MSRTTILIYSLKDPVTFGTNLKRGRENHPKDDATVNAMFDTVDVGRSGRISFRQFRKGRTE